MQLPRHGRLPSDALYIGRGCSARGLAPSPWANPHSIREVGSRHRAVKEFRKTLFANKDLMARLPELSGLRLACHCDLRQACHGDVPKETYLAAKA